MPPAPPHRPRGVPPSGPQQISVAPQPPGPPNVPSSVQAGADANLLVATVQLGSDQRHQAAITWAVLGGGSSASIGLEGEAGQSRWKLVNKSGAVNNKWIPTVRDI